jgi:hypothetical protein
MKIKVNLKKLLYGGFTVLAISLSLIFIFKDLLYLFELRSLDIRFHLRDMSNRNPVIHEKIINVNIDDFSRKESGKIKSIKRDIARLLTRLNEMKKK